MADRWSVHDTTKFVELYEQQENLWNVFTPDYRDRMKRMKSMEIMIEGMEMPSLTLKDVARKITNLRTTYHQEVRKVERSKGSGAGDNVLYKPSLKWFGIMDRIIKKTKDRGTIDNLESSLENPKLEEIFVVPKTYSIEESPNETQKNTKRCERNKPGTSGIIMAIKEMKELNKNLNTPTASSEDECDIIGKRVAYQLRHLPVHAMMQADAEIQQILNKYKLQHLSSLSHSYGTGTP